MARLLAFALLAGSALAQNVVHYNTTIDNVKYLFATAAPVARLHSGDILDTNTLDCFGNALHQPGDTLSMAKGDNPLAGPFYVEGAEPGDTLAVKILDLQVDGDTGVGAFAPGFGALNETNYTPMLHPPLPEKIWFYPIDHAANAATFKALDSDFSVKIPLRPFFGCIGVAPAEGEARSSVVPAEFGGNMDSPEVSKGNTVYFPVNVKGGLLYVGDGHAAMGDGEIAGTAIEVPLKARMQLTVIKGRTIHWPQFENDDAIMTVGAYRPLDDALRIAFTELVHWIHKDYGLSELDAYELLSQVGKIHLNEMVDPNYVVVTSIEKKYLPPAKKP
jgi:amidase